MEAEGQGSTTVRRDDLMDGGLVRTERCPHCGALKTVGRVCPLCGQEASAGTPGAEAAVQRAGAAMPARGATRVGPRPSAVIALATIGVVVVALALFAGYRLLTSDTVDQLTEAASPGRAIYQGQIASSQSLLHTGYQDLLMALAPLPDLTAVDGTRATEVTYTFEQVYEQWKTRRAPDSLAEAHAAWLAGVAGMAEAGRAIREGLQKDDPGAVYDARARFEEQYLVTSDAAARSLAPPGGGA